MGPAWVEASALIGDITDSWGFDGSGLDVFRSKRAASRVVAPSIAIHIFGDFGRTNFFATHFHSSL